MRVCFIEDTHLHGGTQIWVSEALRDFLDKGHDVTLLTPKGGFNAEDAAGTAARLCTYDYDAVVQEDAESRAIWADAFADADVAVCTVHPPRDGFHCSRFAARCIEESGSGCVLLPKTGTIVPEYERLFYAPSEKIRSHVISITDFTRRCLIDDYGIPADRVALIYQGTDVVAFAPREDDAAEARRRFPVPQGAFPVLGNVGSFEERKGQTVLLDALDIVRRELPDVHLILVGDGPDEEMLKKKVTAQGLDSHVSFFPFTREPRFVYEAMDILVLSSTSKEGLPNVILEASSMELPVVSTRLAGVPEAVIEGETGRMVAPGDAAGLAAAISAIGADRGVCRDMGRAGRELMLERFDKRRQFDAFLEFFASL